MPPNKTAAGTTYAGSTHRCSNSALSWRASMDLHTRMPPIRCTSKRARRPRHGQVSASTCVEMELTDARAWLVGRLWRAAAVCPFASAIYTRRFYYRTRVRRTWQPEGHRAQGCDQAEAQAQAAGRGRDGAGGRPGRRTRVRGILEAFSLDSIASRDNSYYTTSQYGIAWDTITPISSLLNHFAALNPWKSHFRPRSDRLRTEVVPNPSRAGDWFWWPCAMLVRSAMDIGTCMDRTCRPQKPEQADW